MRGTVVTLCIASSQRSHMTWFRLDCRRERKQQEKRIAKLTKADKKPSSSGTLISNVPVVPQREPESTAQYREALEVEMRRAKEEELRARDEERRRIEEEEEQARRLEEERLERVRLEEQRQQQEALEKQREQKQKPLPVPVKKAAEAVPPVPTSPPPDIPQATAAKPLPTPPAPAVPATPAPAVPKTITSTSTATSTSPSTPLKTTTASSPNVASPSPPKATAIPTTPTATPSPTPAAKTSSGSSSKLSKKFGGGDDCANCGKRVYLQEKLVVGGMTMHNTCFKCVQCCTLGCPLCHYCKACERGH